jgi:glycerophosphoryl diester phosphodiesterase
MVVRENTIEAFTEALRMGADGVECDVRRSADGALVVHHDPDVPGLGPIFAHRAADLPAYIPRLAAAIEACGDRLVNVELKELPGQPGYDPVYPMARMVVQVVVERGWQDRIILSSFDLLALDAAKEAAEEAGEEAAEEAGETAAAPLRTGWLTPSSFDQAGALRTVIERGHRALHPQHESVTEALVSAAHQAGISVNTWTVDDPERIRQLDRMGVDAIITNVPDLARAALAP